MKLFATVFFCTVLSNAAAHAREPTVLVYNINAQRTELSQNSDQIRSMASVTKLMTAMVALDHNRDLQQQLVLRKNTGSRLPPGRYTREQLLLAMLVSSDNGAAETIAQNYPGGRSAFVSEMNRHARMWNLQDTKFVDPSGLGVFNVTTTGFTNLAGWCVAMLVEHNKQQYAVIVLGASSKLDRSAIIKKVFKNL
jgi:D-alanyl-D-alanine endopeptidase (penicillin-binding protein 7)